jgi:hypothetical protein
MKRIAIYLRVSTSKQGVYSRAVKQKDRPEAVFLLPIGLRAAPNRVSGCVGP